MNWWCELERTPHRMKKPLQLTVATSEPQQLFSALGTEAVAVRSTLRRTELHESSEADQTLQPCFCT